MADTNNNQRIQRLVNEAKLIMPPQFITGVGDQRICAFLDLVLGDMNLFPPLSGYTLENCPQQWEVVLKYGTQIFSTFFLQQQFALQDFSWNDNGLSINLDRVQKLDSSVKGILEMYKTMVLNAKKAELLRVGGKGLGTSRVNQSISAFLKVALGSSYTWGSPN